LTPTDTSSRLNALSARLTALESGMSALPDQSELRLLYNELRAILAQLQDDQSANGIETLRRAEEHFRAAQDLSLDAFAVLRAVRGEDGAIIDFVYEYANSAAARITRRAAEEMIGHTLLEIFPGTQDEAFANYVRVVETGVSHDTEMRYQADGIDGWFRIMSVRLGDGVAVSFSDITERKRTEFALELLAVSTAVLVSSLDEETMIQRTVQLAVPTLADWCALNVLGESGEIRLVGLAHLDPAEERRLLELSRLHPLDPQGDLGTARVLRTGDQEFYPDAPLIDQFRHLNIQSYLCLPLKARDRLLGSLTLATRLGGRRYDSQDLAVAEALARRVALAIDNARLYRAEQRERAIAEQAAAAEQDAKNRLAFLAEADFLMFETMDYRERLQRLARLAVPTLADICIVDLLEEGNQLQRAAVAHLDQSREPLFYEQIARFAPQPGVPGPLWDALESGRPLLRPEVEPSFIERYARNDEHLALLRAIGIFTSMMIVPLKARGRVLGALSFGRIGDQRYQEADLVLAEELARRAAVAIDNARHYQIAQEAIRVRDMFFSVAAHELRTPITSLLGQAQLLQRRADRDGHLNERDRRSASVIVAQAQRLSQMVNALLDIARLEQGRLDIERAPVDLGDLTRRVIEEAQPTLDRHSLVYQRGQMPLVVLGDALRLEQVLQNLLSNAVKYSPAGGTIRVSAELREDGACISITDEGIGIPAASLPHLFQRFYRAGNAEIHTIGGMGIGLYVVKEIVTLHGGTVEVSSVEGRGSTFSICLPPHAPGG
jgi:PAS domain S-box-containing protein